MIVKDFSTMAVDIYKAMRGLILKKGGRGRRAA
jgi:hypothetical protein